MTEQSQLIGEIHATVKALNSKLDRHLDDYAETKKKIDKVEKRQIAVLAWMTGIGASVGGSITAFWDKLGQ